VSTPSMLLIASSSEGPESNSSMVERHPRPNSFQNIRSLDSYFQISVNVYVFERRSFLILIDWLIDWLFWVPKRVLRVSKMHF
jgi:hypothetical protein